MTNTTRTFRKDSQNDRLLNYLKTHKSITQLEAMQIKDLRIMRLAARISDLRTHGVNIRTAETIRHSHGKAIRFARYVLEEE